MLLQKGAVFGQQPQEDEKQLTPSWPMKSSAAGLLPRHLQELKQQSCWKPFNGRLATLTLAVFQPTTFEVQASDRNLETTLSTAWFLVRGQADQKIDRDTEREADRAPASPSRKAGQSQGATPGTFLLKKGKKKLPPISSHIKKLL